MFEIETGSVVNSRQRNAASKARTERPTLFQMSADVFDVLSTTYGGNRYQVRFLRSDDKVFAMCNCDAGVKSNPCYHVMAAYEVYATQLARAGQQLLNRQSVGSLGYVGTLTPNPAAKVISLQRGQTFTATASVKLTVEPNS